ncbi:MAG: DUF3999 domain-containing protein [Uliginosibacterium sp.]|nr:DUF3999 domain-containing protein [Uliginosibacterium sp.]
MNPRPLLAAAACGLCLALPGAASAQDKPASFATRLPVQTLTRAPYYRVDLPIEVYQAAAFGDLRDLRVFNAGGQAVPHTRLAASSEMATETRKTALRWFPLSAPATGAPEATPDQALAIVVKQNADGSLVEIHSNTGKSGATAGAEKAETLRGYVLDASPIAARESLRSLEIDWRGTPGNFQLVDLDASDDLQHWRRIQTGIQLARLEFNGERIERRQIELNGLRERYLRLIWREPAVAPALTDAIVEQTATHWAAAPISWSVPVPPSPDSRDLKPGEYAYKLPLALPLRQLRLQLPPGNVLLPLEVLVPAPDRRRWRPLARSVVYRITSNGREWSQNEIPLPGGMLDEFVVRIDPRSNTLPHGPLLAYGLEPAQLIFLSSGEPPYQVAVGNRQAQDAALPAMTLIPGFGSQQVPEIGLATLKTGVQLGADPTATAPAASGIQPLPTEPRNWKKIILWSVLIAGVLGMALMAWQLLRQMNKPANIGSGGTS